MGTRDKVISITFVAVMVLTLGYWLFDTTSWTMLGTLSALACFSLFVLIGLRAIPPVTAYLLSSDQQVELQQIQQGAERSRAWRSIIVWMVVSRVLILVLGYALYTMHHGYSGGLLELLEETWRVTSIDSRAYLGIAENGYVTEGDSRFHIVFFPLFPALIRFANYFIADYVAAGFIVSNMFTILAALIAYELASLDMKRSDAMRVVKYIFILPAAFFFILPMTEALFLTLSLAAVYAVRRNRWLYAGILAALAAFTRSPGILLAVPIAVEMVRGVITAYKGTDRGAFFRKWTSALGVLAIIPLGLAAYLYVNYDVTGNPFQYSIYQKEHWSQKLYFFFDTARYQWEYLSGTFKNGEKSHFLGIWLPSMIAIFSSLYVMFKSAKQLHPSYTAYFIVYFAFVIGPTWLLSAPRYLTVAFPIAFALALLTKDRTRDAVATCLCVFGTLLYLAAFVIRYPVY